MGRWPRWCAGLATALALLGGCGQTGPADRAANAEAWIEGFDAEYARGNQGVYLAPEIILDAVMMGDFGYLAQGRRDVVGLMDTVVAAEKFAGPLYLSGGGAARPYSLVWWEPDVYPTILRSSIQQLAISEDGITEMTMLAPTWLDYTVSYRQPVAIAAADDLAARYVEAWNSGVAADVARLYAPEAVLADDVVGVEGNGSQAIGALAPASVPIVLARTHEVFPDELVAIMPEGAWAAPSVFFAISWDYPAVAHKVLLVVESDAACPGRSMVALELDEKHRILREERLHLAESISGCAVAASAPDGWWTDREPPLPFQQRVSATVETENGVITICNGSPACESSVRWAVGRFEAAGLPLPPVSTVTFNPLDDRCDSARGHAEIREGSTAILICADPLADDPPGAAAPPQPAETSPIPGLAHLLLHEFGHAWLNEYLDPADEERFTAHVGLDSWSDRDEAWHDRAVEWAAETLAWGLRGTPGSALALGDPDCELLAEGYRILTGQTPPSPCLR